MFHVDHDEDNDDIHSYSSQRYSHKFMDTEPSDIENGVQFNTLSSSGQV